MLLRRWGAVAITSLLAAPLIAAKQPARDGSSLLARFHKPAETSASREYRYLEELLGDASWKTQALRAIAMNKGTGAPPLTSPAAQAQPNTPIDVPHEPVRLLTGELSGTPESMNCELSAKVGERELSKQVARDGALRIGTLVEPEHGVALTLECQASGFCLWGCHSTGRALLNEPTGTLTLAPTAVVLRHNQTDANREHDSGPDRDPAHPQLIAAADAPAHITPFVERVSYRELDTTDYVRVYPVANYMSALLCAHVPITAAVRVRADNQPATIGAPIFDQRCVAASANNWDGLVFQVMSNTVEGFDYEIIALSGESSPELGLVAWFVAKRLTADAKLTRTQRRDTARELMRVFDVKFAKDRQKLEVLGDQTVVAFLDMLADISEQP